MLSYIFDSSGHRDRYLKKNEYLRFCNFRQINVADLEKELIKKDLFRALRKGFNTKFICLNCKKKTASAFSEHRSRHCYDCRDEFKALSKLKAFVTVRARKSRLKSTNDGTITAKSLRDLMAAQGTKCAACKVDLVTNYHLDHIYPISKGGKHTMSNVQYLCQPCNNRKYNSVSYVAGS